MTPERELYSRLVQRGGSAEQADLDAISSAIRAAEARGRQAGVEDGARLSADAVEDYFLSARGQLSINAIQRNAITSAIERAARTAAPTAPASPSDAGQGKQEGAGEHRVSPDPVLVAALLAHRACTGIEASADATGENGKIHGYCVVCGVPWPCEVAQTGIDAARRLAASGLSPGDSPLAAPDAGAAQGERPEPPHCLPHTRCHYLGLWLQPWVVVLTATDGAIHARDSCSDQSGRPLAASAPLSAAAPAPPPVLSADLVELFREARRWLPGYKRELRAAIDDAALASLDRAGALQEEKQE